MKHLYPLAGALALAILLLGCPSTPPAAHVEEPSAEAPAEPVAALPDEPVTEPPAEKPPAAVTDEEVAAARAALALARDWAAEFYARTEWEAAASSFTAAIEARESDPARSRSLLFASIGRSDAAYRAAVEGFATDMTGRITEADERLTAMGAGRWIPQPYRDALAAVDAVRARYEAGDHEEARRLVFAALRGLLDLEDDLGRRLHGISDLREQTQNAMVRAEELQAILWAPDERQGANDQFVLALRSYAEGDLVAAEPAFLRARDMMNEVVRITLERRVDAAVRDQAEADRLMDQIAADLEAAADLTVIGDDGTPVEPVPWSAEEELRRLQEETQPQSMRILSSGTFVLGDVSTVAGVLEEARAEWRQGVAANGRGEPSAALEHFRLAQRLLEIYRSQAVKGTYEVRLVPDARDCLWRIAAYPSVYGNPRLWPLLWLGNWAAIPDPDLVEPGLVLAIPPIAPDRDRQVGEAYWLAGRQYEAAGSDARGREYREAALSIWPSLDAREVALPEWFDVATAVARATDVPGPQATAFVESVRSAFLRLGGAFRDGDGEAMLAFFAGSLYLSDRGEEVDRDRVRALLEEMLDDGSLAALPWAALFDLDSLLFSDETKEGGPAIVMAARVTADLPENLGRSGSTTFFHYRRIDGTWKIAGLGLTGVPAAWTPRPAPEVAASRVPTLVPAPVPTASEIRDAFTEWLGAWLSGDRDRGAALTGEILELREAGERLTGDAVDSALEAWFGAPLVQGLEVQDVVDTEGAIVEPEEDGTWRVSVRSQLDLSEAVPYWKSYQEYWLALNGDGLEVIAVF